MLVLVCFVVAVVGVPGGVGFGVGTGAVGRVVAKPFERCTVFLVAGWWLPPD